MQFVYYFSYTGHWPFTMSDMDTTHRSHKVGIVYILIAWLLFTFMTIIARFTSKTIPLASILFIQNLIGLITLIPWIQKHGWGLMRTRRFGLLLFRSMASISAIALSFLAVQRTSLVDTMLLNNSSPLWIPFVVLIWLKKPINHFLWPGLIAGFIGIVLILNPGKSFFKRGLSLRLPQGSCKASIWSPSGFSPIQSAITL